MCCVCVEKSRSMLHNTFRWMCVCVCVCVCVYSLYIYIYIYVLVMWLYDFIINRILFYISRINLYAVLSWCARNVYISVKVEALLHNTFRWMWQMLGYVMYVCVCVCVCTRCIYIYMCVCVCTRCIYICVCVCVCTRYIYVAIGILSSAFCLFSRVNGKRTMKRCDF